MKSIGGFLPLESRRTGNIFHKEAIALNTGRNSFELLLRANKWAEKVWLPYYLCEVLIEPLEKLGVDYGFYPLNTQFLPESLFDNPKEIIFYINYFGVCDANVLKLSKKYTSKLIIDNTQAFFSKPVKQVAGTFYSTRKFFGVPDGAFLYSKAPISLELEQDISYQRCEHLLKRLDLGPELAYEDFLRNDKSLSGQPVKKMSKLTNAILQSIDYEKTFQIRKQNFQVLHQFFSDINEFRLEIKSIGAPLCYPLLIKNGKRIKEKFIEKKVFVPTYWPNLEAIIPSEGFEKHLINNLVCLPVDQRYSKDDMNYIISIYQEFEKQ